MAEQRWLRLRQAAFLALPFGVYGWAICFAILLGFDGKIAQGFDAFGTDWMIFYAAARAWFENNLVHVYDQVWFKATVNAAFAKQLVVPLSFPAFHYPPPYLLILLPFGLLSFGWGLAAFEAVGGIAMLVALRAMFSDRKVFCYFAVALLLCPATSYTVHQGQNVLLIVALLIGGFALLPRRPILAGIVLGFLCLKPQSALLVPVALIAARQWRTLTAAVATGAALAGLSAVVFGADFWIAWLQLVVHPRHDVAMTGIEWGRTWDSSVYTCFRYFGAAKGLANVAQAVAMLVAAWAVYRSYRSRGCRDAAFCVLLAASVVASPHPSPYDMVPLALAATVYLWQAAGAADYRPLHLFLPLALWLAPLYNPPIAAPVGLLTPALIFAFIAQVAMRNSALRDAFLGRPDQPI